METKDIAYELAQLVKAIQKKYDESSRNQDEPMIYLYQGQTRGIWNAMDILDKYIPGLVMATLHEVEAP